MVRAFLQFGRITGPQIDGPERQSLRQAKRCRPMKEGALRRTTER
jgi:hypothetical protein